MISSVDHLIIAVKDLNQAINDYEKVLGVSPCWKGKHSELGTKNALFNFENTYLDFYHHAMQGLEQNILIHCLKRKEII